MTMVPPNEGDYFRPPVVPYADSVTTETDWDVVRTWLTYGAEGGMVDAADAFAALTRLQERLYLTESGLREWRRREHDMQRERDTLRARLAAAEDERDEVRRQTRTMRESFDALHTENGRLLAIGADATARANVAEGGKP